MQSIGIEHDKPFDPDAKMKTLLSEAARMGAAMSRTNIYASPGLVEALHAGRLLYSHPLTHYTAS